MSISISLLCKKMSRGNLILKTATWERESNGLFDYESRSMLKRKLILNEPSTILRQGDATSTLPIGVQNKYEDGTKYLASVSIEDSSYIMTRCILDKSIVDPVHCEKLWVVVKSLQSGYRISAGDIIRIGRVRIRVNEIEGPDFNLNLYSPTPLKTRQISLGGLNPPELYNGKKDLLHVNVPETDTEEDAAVKQACRICLSDGSEDSDPLISPCKCMGTMGLVHLKCLQHWFNSKISSRERHNSKSFSWKALECELCKLAYPEKIEVKGTYHSLVEMPKPEGSYIILEVFGKDRNTKTFHVISLSNKNNVRLVRYT